MRAVSGSGVNTLEQEASGSGYSLNNGIVSVGALSACTSVAASGDGASLSQSVSGGGNLGVSLEGTQGTSASGQEAMVLGGVMTTSQSLSAGDGIASGQSTAMVGAAGYVSSGALSEENRMALAGGFDGQGDMTAALSTSSSSGERAEVGGGVSVYGTQWFGDGDLEAIASENMGVTVSGLQALEDGGVGSFDLSAENADSDMLDRVGAAAAEEAASGGDVAVSTNYQGGSYSSYELIGWRWNQQDPQIQLYVKDDSNLLNEGLTGPQAQSAISAAANAWDDAVAQNLFADGETVKIDATKNTDTYDHYNVHAWKQLSDAPGAIAYARTWYTTDASKKVDGYYQALESDVSYSTDYGWRTNLNDGTNRIDVQSVAMHELGHTIGLADLYNLPSDDPRKYDYEQIMNLYDGPQRYLGNGDKTAARLLYGQDDFYVFARGDDNALWCNVDGSWINLGGYITSDPIAVKDSNGRIHVFVRGRTGPLYTNYIDTADNSVGGWVSLGGYLTSNPGAVIDSQGHIQVFVRGGTGALYNNYLNSWDRSSGNWICLGGYITSDPGVAMDSHDRVQLFVRGGTGALYSNYLNSLDRSSGNWNYIGGSLLESGSNPNVIIDDEDRAHVFICDETNALSTYDTSSQIWKSLGGYITSDPSTAIDSQGHIHISVRGRTGSLYTNYLNTDDMSSGSWSFRGGSLVPESNPYTIIDHQDKVYAFIRDETNVISTLDLSSNCWKSLEGKIIDSDPLAM